MKLFSSVTESLMSCAPCFQWSVLNLLEVNESYHFSSVMFWVVAVIGLKDMETVISRQISVSFSDGYRYNFCLHNYLSNFKALHIFPLYSQEKAMSEINSYLTLTRIIWKIENHFLDRIRNTFSFHFSKQKIPTLISLWIHW